MARRADTCWRRTFRSSMHELQIVARIIRQFPSTCLLPLAVLVLLISLESSGMYYVAKQLKSARQMKTASHANATAAAIQLQVLLTFKPLNSLEAIIHQMPRWPQLQGMVTPFLDEVIPKDQDQDGDHVVAAVMPNGHFSLQVGPDTSDSMAFNISHMMGTKLTPPSQPTMPWPMAAGNMSEPMGGNMSDAMGGSMAAVAEASHCADFLGCSNRDFFLDNIQKGHTSVSTDRSCRVLSMIRPVYIQGARPNDSFGYPKPATNCSVCYDPTKRRKFWGFVAMLLPLKDIAKSLLQDLQSFHRYALLAPVIPPFVAFADTNDSHSGPPAPMTNAFNTACLVVSSTPHLPHTSHAVRVGINITGNYQWWLLVDGGSQDVEVITNSILAVGVVGACVLAVLLFSTLVSRRKLQMLLASLVPDAVIKQMQKQAKFLMKDNSQRPILTAGSPADLMLQVVSELAAGRQPALSDALVLRTALLQKWDLYTPVDLRWQLQQGPLEGDVAQALMQQLVGGSLGGVVHRETVPPSTLFRQDSGFWSLQMASVQELQPWLMALMTSDGSSDILAPPRASVTPTDPLPASDNCPTAPHITSYNPSYNPSHGYYKQTLPPPRTPTDIHTHRIKAGASFQSPPPSALVHVLPPPPSSPPAPCCTAAFRPFSSFSSSSNVISAIGNIVTSASNTVVSAGNNAISTGNHTAHTSNNAISTGNHTARTSNNAISTGSNNVPGTAGRSRLNTGSSIGTGPNALTASNNVVSADFNTVSTRSHVISTSANVVSISPNSASTKAGTVNAGANFFSTKADVVSTNADVISTGLSRGRLDSASSIQLFHNPLWLGGEGGTDPPLNHSHHGVAPAPAAATASASFQPHQLSDGGSVPYRLSDTGSAPQHSRCVQGRLQRPDDTASYTGTWTTYRLAAAPLFPAPTGQGASTAHPSVVTSSSSGTSSSSTATPGRGSLTQVVTPASNPAGLKATDSASSTWAANTSPPPAPASTLLSPLCIPRPPDVTKHTPHSKSRCCISDGSPISRRDQNHPSLPHAATHSTSSNAYTHSSKRHSRRGKHRPPHSRDATASHPTTTSTSSNTCTACCPTATARPSKHLLQSAERALLAATSTWQFDAFELAEATNGRPLSSLAFYLMHQQGLIKRFNLDTMALARYLRTVEEGYSPTNPYHNSTHAADVLQSLHAILHKGGLLAEGYADDLAMMAAYLAAVVHDYNHKGLTNDFLINTQDDLAYRYNDKSPMENHHIAAAWLLLKNPGMDFMAQMSKSEVTLLRKIIIDLVLATDMKQHFSIITHFAATTSSRAKADAPLAPEGGSAAPVSTHTHTGADGCAVVCVSEAERLAVLQLALKCSDLGHTTAARHVHKRWLSCLEEEFFLQGDLEKSRGMPISPLFDRSKPGASKSQVGFYNVVVLPMYSAFCVAFPDTSPLLEGAKSNFQHWQSVQAPMGAST